MRTLNCKHAGIAAALLLVSGLAAANNLIGLPSSTEITVNDCDSAWAQAAANSSCPKSSVSLHCSTFGQQTQCRLCILEADCYTGVGNATASNRYDGGPAGLKTLINCDGVLKLSTTC